MKVISGGGDWKAFLYLSDFFGGGRVGGLTFKDHIFERSQTKATYGIDEDEGWMKTISTCSTVVILVSDGFYTG